MATVSVLRTYIYDKSLWRYYSYLTIGYSYISSYACMAIVLLYVAKGAIVLLYVAKGAIAISRIRGPILD